MIYLAIAQFWPRLCGCHNNCTSQSMLEYMSFGSMASDRTVSAYLRRKITIACETCRQRKVVTACCITCERKRMCTYLLINRFAAQGRHPVTCALRTSSVAYSIQTDKGVVLGGNQLGTVAHNQLFLLHHRKPKLRLD